MIIIIILTLFNINNVYASPGNTYMPGHSSDEVDPQTKQAWMQEALSISFEPFLNIFDKSSCVVYDYNGSFPNDCATDEVFMDLNQADIKMYVESWDLRYRKVSRQAVKKDECLMYIHPKTDNINCVLKAKSEASIIKETGKCDVVKCPDQLERGNPVYKINDEIQYQPINVKLGDGYNLIAVFDGQTPVNDLELLKGDNIKIENNLINTSDLKIGDYVFIIANKNKTFAQGLRIKVVPFESCSNYDGLLNTCNSNKYCFYSTINNKCYNKQDNSICKNVEKNFCGTEKGSQACSWSDIQNECVPNLAATTEDRYPVPDKYYTEGSGILPACAFAGSCDDVNDLLELGIRVGEWLFGIIGSLAFAFFIYGGFSMIWSFGNAEKFKKGGGVLVAAVIGMVISFSAYILVKFLLNSLGVEESWINLIYK